MCGIFKDNVGIVTIREHEQLFGLFAGAGRIAGRCRRIVAGAPGSVPGKVAGKDLFGL